VIRVWRGFGGRVRCRGIAARLDAYVDGELNAGERQRVAAHLAACETCRLRHDKLARQVAVLESFPRVSPAADLRGRIMAALPERPAVRRPQPRVAAWRPALAVAMLGAIVAAALWLAPPANNRKPSVRPTPHSPAATARRPAAPSSVTAGTAHGPTVAIIPRQHANPPSAARKGASAPQLGKPVAGQPTEVASAPREYRALGSSYEQEGRLDEALAAYEQADAAEQARSLDSARVYERLGYTAQAADGYADLAFAPLYQNASSSDGG